VARMVRCKVCGYVMPEGKLKDKCPACGVAAKAFEPWEDPLSEPRRKALALDLHPIAVHFPTAFIVSLIVIFIVGLAFRGRAAGLFLCAGRLMALFQPLLVVAAFLLGVKDGIVRFRSVGRSEILKRKILFGLLYFAFAVALPLVVWLWGVDGAAPLAVALALSAAGLACNVVLSVLGISMLHSAMPGK
jgi:Rubrerythrin, rubredoxin-like domain